MSVCNESKKNWEWFGSVSNWTTLTHSKKLGLFGSSGCEENSTAERRTLFQRRMCVEAWTNLYLDQPLVVLVTPKPLTSFEFRTVQLE